MNQGGRCGRVGSVDGLDGLGMRVGRREAVHGGGGDSLLTYVIS